MAAASNSDDVSDIFWPGYVDAISNLAINLLFVIAVMSIVVLGSSLQMAELMKKDHGLAISEQNGRSDTAQDTRKNKSGALELKAEKEGQSTTVDSATPTKTGTGPAFTRALDTAGSRMPDKSSDKSKDQDASNTPDTGKEVRMQDELETLMERNRQLTASLRDARNAQKAAEQQAATAGNALKKALTEASEARSQAKANAATNAEMQIEELNGEGKVETVVAKTARQAQPDQRVNAINARQNGLLVRFTEGALDLSPAEAAEVITKLRSFGPLPTTGWRITVVAPKGFSEALRLAYYRANSVRNALLAAGVPSNAIDLSIGESTRTSADNTLVSVRPKP